MLAEHIAKKADVTVACIEVPRAKAHEFGIMSIEPGGRIVRFAEKPDEPETVPGNPDLCLASMGIYIFNARFLYGLLEEDAELLGSNHDFGRDIIPSLLGRHRLIAHRFQDSTIMDGGGEVAYWRDVGTLDAYWEANMDLCRITPGLNMYDDNWPIWTEMLRNPPAKFVFDSDDRRGMAVDSMVADGCIVSGALVRRSMLFSDVRANSYSLVEDSVVLPKAVIGRKARIRRAIIDQGCEIPPGLVVGEDEEADARRFHRTEGGVTLVTVPMLEALTKQA